MEQEKIGKFLSEVRKELGMTQQQLADGIGVSNKTISKWETGKGMPELSSMMPLCEVLGISINELISGERLTEECYPEKAEENIMYFIKETENSRKNMSVVSIFIIAITIICTVWFTIFSSGGVRLYGRWFDIQTLFEILSVTAVILILTKLGCPFLQSFQIITGKKHVSYREMKRVKEAVKLAGNIVLAVGILISCINYPAAISVNEDVVLALEAWKYSMPFVASGSVYGLAGYLLLLPVGAKLESMCVLNPKDE